MTVKLIPDKGNGVRVNAPATVKRVVCETHCPKCKHLSHLGARTALTEKRHCHECKLTWDRGTWCYLVEFIEPEATNERA